jgi:hypothetical protein
MRKAAVKIQTIMRRYLTRRHFMRNYKKLVKERNRRVRIQRTNAALMLQGTYAVVYLSYTILKNMLISGFDIV